MSIAAIIVAAGRGTRAGGQLPKQWQGLAGRSVAAWTVGAFSALPEISAIALVINPEDAPHAEPLLGGPVFAVHGGATRDASVRAGLEALRGRGVSRVLIHDVARPCVSPATIRAVLSGLTHAPGAAPALEISDALWRGEAARVTGTEDRAGLFRAQTPQGFHYDAIMAAHELHPGGAADDVEVARAAGLDVAIVPGEEANLKITRPGDFARAENLLEGAMDIRIGNGYDVHRFAEGDHVTLCGVKVPHDKRLDGHSDADVGMHAVTDAIYGALAAGDIGRHFPPSDPQWKGADSRVFLEHATGLAAERGYRIGNLDCTLICERPRIGPHADEMRDRMGELIGLAPDRISIKATTSERLGFTGREEGIAAIATVTLIPA